MEKKEEKRYRQMSVLLLIITRVVQVGIIILLFRMVPSFFDAAEAMHREPLDRYDRGRIVGIGLLPLIAIIPVLCFTEGMRIKIKIKLTGKTNEQYKEFIISKTPPEVMEKAKSYEANGEKLGEYLRSIKDEIGFTKDELVYLYSMCIDLKKDYDRKENEKRRAEEEERAKREAAFPKREPFFSEETHKKMDEAKERIKSYLKRK